MIKVVHLAIMYKQAEINFCFHLYYVVEHQCFSKMIINWKYNYLAIFLDAEKGKKLLAQEGIV